MREQKLEYLGTGRGRLKKCVSIRNVDKTNTIPSCQENYILQLATPQTRVRWRNMV